MLIARDKSKNIEIEDVEDIAYDLNFELSQDQMQEVVELYPDWKAQADADALGDRWWNVVEQILYADFSDFQVERSKEEKEKRRKAKYGS